MRWMVGHCAGLALALAVAAAGAARAQGAADVASRLGRAAAAASADFDIYLPPRNPAQLDRLLSDLQDPASPRHRKWLTPAEFADAFGPDETMLGRVRAELAAHGMTVTERFTQSLHVRASAGAVEAAFATRLSRGRFADGDENLVAEAPLALTDALRRAGAVVPQFAGVRHRRGFLRAGEAAPFDATGLSASGAVGPYYTHDLRQAYDFPDMTALSGKGAVIGVLATGAIKATDISGYFAKQKLATPTLTIVPINGGAAFNSNSTESTLDITQAGGMAPGAAIYFYNSKSYSDADLQAGLRQIIADNKVDVVNMSWGEAEVAFQAKYNNGFDQRPQMTTYKSLFQQGNAQGITFVAASGDSGSKPVIGGAALLSVNHPASDPYVTGVGGANLVTSYVRGSTASTYVSENANYDKLPSPAGAMWASGGGVSITFARPTWQASVPTGSTTFRTVPDVAMHMGGCPNTATKPCGANRSGNWLLYNGAWINMLGTSAAAPQFTGLVALKVALARGTAAAPAGRLGNLNPDIYAKLAAQIAGGAPVYRHSAIVGSNGNYTVKAPYDMVIGAGTVDARQFIGAMSLPAAGNPGTPGNP